MQTLHKARLFWFPAYQKHMVRCIICGQTLVENPDVDTFDVPGDCVSPPRLQVEVEESIKAKDIFG
jgi:hypothetical protein